MSVEYRAENEPVASRVDYWRHVVDTTIAPVEFRLECGPDFHGRIRAGAAGAVRVTELTVPPAVVNRSPRVIDGLDPDLCKIDVQIDGRMVVEQDDRQAPLRPGDFTLVDLSRPGRWVNSPVRFVSVVFPRTMLPLRTDELARLTGVRMSGGDGVAGLVSSLARQLMRHVDQGDGARLGTALLDLLSVALAQRIDRPENLPPETRQRVLLLRVQAYIEERLGDPLLSPQSIAAAHHISLRALYNLFKPQGEPVAAWVRRRRLERCRRDLRDPALRIRPVSAIGAQWGFVHPDHFSRVFRAAFGVSPNEYRRAVTLSFR